MNIENLTAAEVRLLKRLWAIDTREEMKVFMESLTRSEILLAESLTYMLLYGGIDAQIDRGEIELTEAVEALAKYKLDKQ